MQLGRVTGRDACLPHSHAPLALAQPFSNSRKRTRKERKGKGKEKKKEKGWNSGPLYFALLIDRVPVVVGIWRHLEVKSFRDDLLRHSLIP
jgi:hypothetical protein